MSLFDFSFMSVPPEGGTDALAAGVPTGPKDEAPPDVFAQLLAAFSNLPEDARPSAVPPAEAPEEMDPATEFPSVSPEGWEGIEATSESEPEEDSQDYVMAPSALTTFLMPVPPAETVTRRGEHASDDRAGSSNGSQAVESSGGRQAVMNLPEEAPGLAGGANERSAVATDALETVFARKVERALPGGPEAPVSAPDVRISIETAAPSADDQVALPHPAPTDQASAAVELPRALRGLDRPSSVEKADVPKGAATSAPDSVDNVTALAASLERRAGGQGESHADLASRTLSASRSWERQPQQTAQAFHHVVAAALQTTEVSASTTATPPASSTAEAMMSPSDGGGLESQIVQGIRRLWRGGAEEIRVTLRPQYLGALTISLKVDRNVVNAVLHVEEPQVRAWVQAHEGQLRQAMSSQGLSLEQLVITDERPGGDDRGRDAEPRRNRRPTTGTTDGEPAPVFEVAV